VVLQVFDPSARPGTLSAWIGTLGFAAQDYCDFAGYSICAIGLGRCLGLALPDNFRAPFSSVGFRDLWQRWHITLVAWMRDYVFNSLGGVYKGYRRAAINVLVVFFLIGLWHGATWTYIIFGLMHGCFLIGEVILQRSAIRRLTFWNGPLGTFLMWLVTMFLCMLAFVFYRSPQLGQAWSMLLTMFGVNNHSGSLQVSDYDTLVVVVLAECLVVAHWLCRNVPLDELLARVPWWATAMCLALMLLAITLCSGESESYLYFHY
jgi:D-alanyl-lipoteichoic acid acyltransferase DltB (MBOAT superfamily)